MHKWNSVKKTAAQQYNRLLDAAVTIIKYKRIQIDPDICTNVLYDVTVSYLKISSGYIINTTNNETEFTELRRVLEEYFETKVQQGSLIKYLNSRVFQSPLGFIVEQTYQIMEFQ